MTTTRPCEYLILLKDRRHPEGNPLREKCSLTGHPCLCSQNLTNCVARTYALTFEEKQADRIKTIVLVNPKTGLPST
jgi:hypothetical protein